MNRPLKEFPKPGDIWQHKVLFGGSHTFLVCSVSTTKYGYVHKFDALLLECSKDIKDIAWSDNFDGWVKLA